MSKEPPRAVPADPNHRRRPEYIGLYVVWWDDGSWEWIKCVNCGAELTSRTSKERGCGATCASVVTDTMKESILREERISARGHLEAKRRATSRAVGPRPVAPRPVGPRRTSGTRPRKRLLDPPNEFQTQSKPRGISNEQAKELARLQRAAGEAYSGSGMTEARARAEIQRLKLKLAGDDGGMRP